MYHLSSFANEVLILKEGLRARHDRFRHGYKGRAVYLVEEHNFWQDAAFELLSLRKLSVFSVDTMDLKLVADPECLVQGVDPCSFLILGDVALSRVRLIGHYTRKCWKSFVYKEVSKFVGSSLKQVELSYS